MDGKHFCHPVRNSRHDYRPNSPQAVHCRAKPTLKSYSRLQARDVRCPRRRRCGPAVTESRHQRRGCLAGDMVRGETGSE